MHSLYSNLLAIVLKKSTRYTFYRLQATLDTFLGLYSQHLFHRHSLSTLKIAHFNSLITPLFNSLYVLETANETRLSRSPYALRRTHNVYSTQFFPQSPFCSVSCSTADMSPASRVALSSLRNTSAGDGCYGTGQRNCRRQSVE